MPLSSAAFDEMMLDVFRPGGSVILTGERGSGKTLTSLALCLYLMKVHDYHILGNVVLKRCIEVLPDGKRKFVKSSYPNYHFVRSFGELMYTIAHLLQKPNRFGNMNRMLWLADEAGGGGGFSAYDSVFSQKSKDLISLLTLARKYQLSTLMLAQSDALLHSKARTVGSGFVSALIRKDFAVVRKRARHLLGMYDKRAISIIEIPEFDNAWEIILTDDIDLPLIKPAERAEVGDVVYDTFSSADFSIGYTGPKSTTKFNLTKLLSFISGEISEDVPARMLEFFEKDGEVHVEFEGMSVEESLKPAVKGTQRYSRETLMPLVLKEGPEVIKGLPKKKRNQKQPIARGLQEVLKEKHDVEISISALRQDYVQELLDHLKNGK